jgi:hypothetical protein
VLNPAIWPYSSAQASSITICNIHHPDAQTAIVFPGGHSSEALSLVSALDFSRYTPRTYLVSEGDSLSAQKAIALEGLKAASAKSPAKGGYRILTIPRARRVYQNILTVPFTTLRSLLAAVYCVTLAPRLSGESAFDVLLLNGPGTCVVLCLAAYVNRVRLCLTSNILPSLPLIPSSWDSLPRDSFISKHLRASESSR